MAAGDSRRAFTLAIRPERILLASDGTPNQFTGEVVETTYTGAETHCVVRVGTETLRVAGVNAPGAARFAAGQSVKLSLPPEALIVLED